MFWSRNVFPKDEDISKSIGPVLYWQSRACYRILRKLKSLIKLQCFSLYYKRRHLITYYNILEIFSKRISYSKTSRGGRSRGQPLIKIDYCNTHNVPPAPRERLRRKNWEIFGLFVISYSKTLNLVNFFILNNPYILGHHIIFWLATFVFTYMYVLYILYILYIYYYIVIL